MNNEQEEIFEKPKNPIGKAIKTFFKAFVALFLIVTWGAIFLRLCTMGDPDEAIEYLWSDAAYQMAQSGTLPEVTTQEYVQTLDEDGLFRVSATRKTEALGQFQLTVRYNNSTVTRMVEDMALSFTPTGEVYVYTLEASDGTLYTDYRFTDSKKTVYQYRTLLFEGVSYTDADGNPIDSFTLHIYYIDDMIPDAPYVDFVVYDTRFPTTEIKLSRPEAATVLRDRPEYKVKSAEG